MTLCRLLSSNGPQTHRQAQCQLQDAVCIQTRIRGQGRAQHRSHADSTAERQGDVQTKQRDICREVERSSCCGFLNIKRYLAASSIHSLICVSFSHSLSLSRVPSPSAWEFQSDIITMMKTDPINTDRYDEYNSDYGGSDNQIRKERLIEVCSVFVFGNSFQPCVLMYEELQSQRQSGNHVGLCEGLSGPLQ